MFWFSYRSLALTFDHQTTLGWIIHAHQPPPSFVRASDYEVQYEFADDQGIVYSGRDVLPPAKPPPKDGRIEIVYSHRDPSISRIESQWSGTALNGVVFGIGIVVWSTFQFARGRRPAATKQVNA
jgi:hypothetical protein